MTWDADEQPEGTFECPLCDNDTPHVHAGNEERFCPHCGTVISVYARFCVKCERKVL